MTAAGQSDQGACGSGCPLQQWGRRSGRGFVVRRRETGKHGFCLLASVNAVAVCKSDKNSRYINNVTNFIEKFSSTA